MSERDAATVADTTNSARCRPKGLLKQKSEAVRAGVHFNQQLLLQIAANQRDELGLNEPVAEKAPATVAAASSAAVSETA